MKTLVLSLLMMSATFLHAQDKKKVAELDIRTSTVCDMCVKTIEENMIYEKGVKAVRVDLETNMIHVEYDAKKNTPEGLRLAVTKLGYYADDLAADPKAFTNLPACCQKEGCGQKAE